MVWSARAAHRCRYAQLPWARLEGAAREERAGGAEADVRHGKGGHQIGQPSQDTLSVDDAERGPERGDSVRQCHRRGHGMPGPGPGPEPVTGTRHFWHGHFHPMAGQGACHGVPCAARGHRASAAVGHRKQVEREVQRELRPAQRQRHHVEAAPTATEEHGTLRCQYGEGETQCARARQPATRCDMAQGAQKQAGGSVEQTRSGPPRPASLSAHRHNLASVYAGASRCPRRASGAQRRAWLLRRAVIAAAGGGC